MSHSWSPTEKVTPEVQDAANKVRADLEHKTGQKFSKFIAVKYRRSPYSKTGEPLPVGATFYLIRVEIGDGKCCNIKVAVVIYPGLPTSLQSYKMNVPCDSPLEPDFYPPIML